MFSCINFARYKTCFKAEMCIARWGRNLLQTFPRRTAANIISSVMPAQVNPLCCLYAFNPAVQLKWCTMHLVNLGILQVLNGSSVVLLLEHSYSTCLCNLSDFQFQIKPNCTLGVQKILDNPLMYIGLGPCVIHVYKSTSSFNCMRFRF